MKKLKIKLPVWFVVMLMFLMSALVSAVVTDARVHRLMDIQIQETSKYPDWFLEWLNTEYLTEHMEE